MPFFNGFCFLGIAAFDNEELKKVKTKEPLSGLDLLKQVPVRCISGAFKNGIVSTVLYLPNLYFRQALSNKTRTTVLPEKAYTVPYQSLSGLQGQKCVL